MRGVVTCVVMVSFGCILGEAYVFEHTVCMFNLQSVVA